MDVFIVRHGETEANEGDVLQGHHDTPLTDVGSDQAETVASRLSDYDFDVIFASPLKRALDTAKIIAQQVHTDIRISEEVKEMCYGEWEGKSKDSLRSEDSWQARTDDKYNFQHPGSFEGHRGESYAEIYDRVSAFFDGVRTEDFDRVVVVTHLGVLRNAKKHFTQCSDEDAVAFTPDPLQIYRIQDVGTEVETELIHCI